MTEDKKLAVVITVKGRSQTWDVRVISTDLTEIAQKFDVTGMAADVYGVVIQVATVEEGAALQKFMENRVPGHPGERK